MLVSLHLQATMNLPVTRGIPLLRSLQVKQLTPLQQLNLLEAMHSNKPPRKGLLQSHSPATAANGHHHKQHDPLSNHPLQDNSTLDAASVQEDGPAEDIAAFGRLVVQLYRGKKIFHQAADHQ